MTHPRVIKTDPYNAETAADELGAAVTPTAAHYVRSNFDLPVLDRDRYRLAIDGDVRQAQHLDLQALAQLPTVETRVTMECAGNDRLGMRPIPAGEPWASGAVATATWGGVRLADVLALAQPLEGTCEVIVTGADRGPRDDALTPGPIPFARGVPLEVAMHPDTLLALTMNGAPLPVAHGAPVRLVVPGWYGMANVKWVVGLTLARASFTGYFQQQRYVYDETGGIRPVTRMRVKSMVTAPVDGATVPLGAITVRGWAWSGEGRITRVELGCGGGDDWQDAVLGEPAGAHAWTPWQATRVVDRPGRLVLRSRATDESGATQPDVAPWNRLGYGNNAVRPVVVHVTASPPKAAGD
jgi:DMSO/TMAO reductase YedYZ molybdopterin-dependent catalytic subunit